MFHILVVDDDKNTRLFLKAVLERASYTVSTAENGEDALDIMDKEHVDLVVLDIMMPKMDGYEFTRTLREAQNYLPILMVSAKQLPADKHKGFLVGTDDYITKPFNPLEVSARVRSQLRRYMQLGAGSVRPRTLVVGTVELDDESKTVTRDGTTVILTPTEFEILKLLMTNPGKVYSPKDIYRALWKEAPMAADNSIAVHIRHIREKLEINSAEPRYVKAVWGHGYFFDGVKN